MKANQKFLRGDDEGVSPVIAVILMVAITVVLAATVYVWVSGFGSNSNSSPAHTMSLASAGAVSGTAATDLYWKNYTVSSADPSLTYGDVTLTIGGTEFTYTPSCGVEANSTAAEAFLWGACGGTTDRALDDGVSAGDRIILTCYNTAENCLSDKDLLILDVEANSVMVTLKVR